MSTKLLNEKIAERARVHDSIAKMYEDGITPERQGAYDAAMADFDGLTKQIEDLKKLSVIDDVKPLEVTQPLDNLRNYLRSGIMPVQNVVSTTTGSMGYTLPEKMHNEIIEKMSDYGAVQGLCDVIQTDSLLDIPVEGTAPTLNWIAENGAYTDSSPTVTRVQLSANKAGMMIKVSEELLADSAFDLESYIVKKCAQALGEGLETEYVAGTQSNRPSGICPNAQAALTSSVSSGFAYSDLVTLYTSVKSGYARNGSFLCSRSVLGDIMKLTDGANQYVFQPSYQAGAPDMLLGRPLYYTDAMPAHAALTTGAVAMLFGDFKQYKIAFRGGTNIQRLNELYAANGQTAFRVWARVDGKLALPEAIKKLVCK